MHNAVVVKDVVDDAQKQNRKSCKEQQDAFSFSPIGDYEYIGDVKSRDQGEQMVQFHRGEIGFGRSRQDENGEYQAKTPDDVQIAPGRLLRIEGMDEHVKNRHRQIERQIYQPLRDMD